jgi:hypothetical protein
MTSQDQQQAAVDWIRLADNPALAAATAENLEDELLFVFAVADQHPALRPGLTPVVRRLITELQGHLRQWNEEAAADENLLRKWDGHDEEHHETTSK